MGKGTLWEAQWVTSSARGRLSNGVILPEAKWDLLTGSCGVSSLCLQHVSAVANHSEPCVMMMTEPRLGLEQDPVFRTLSRVRDHAAA